MWFRATVAVLASAYAISYWMSQSVYRVVVSNSRTLDAITSKMSKLNHDIKDLNNQMVNHYDNIQIEFKQTRDDIHAEFKQTNININHVLDITNGIGGQLQYINSNSTSQFQSLLGQLKHTHNTINDINSNLTSFSQSFDNNRHQLATYTEQQFDAREIVTSIDRKIDYIINMIHPPMIHQ